MSSRRGDLFYYLSMTAGPTDRTFPVSGAVRGPMVGGPLITRPGEVIAPMRALLYVRPQLNTLITELDHGWGHTFQDRLNDIGSGAITLANDDPDLAAVWTNSCAIRFEIEGRAAMTILVDGIDHTAIAEGEEHDQVTTLTGQTNISILTEGVVYPSRGVGVKPYEDNRLFSWPSPEYDDSRWGYAAEVAAFTDSNTYWSGNVVDWPANGAYWIWAHLPDAIEWAPAGPCYMRRNFTVPADQGIESVRICAVLDAFGDVYLDGQLQMSASYDAEPVPTWTADCEVTPGEHTVALVCTNDVDPEADEIHNPGGALIAIYGINRTGEFTGGPLVVSDGSWRIVEYPPQPPGMTPGTVIRLAISEAQNRGCYPEVRLAFTDEIDSAGEPWPITGDISTKIGTTTWVFIGEEMAATYVDVWMSPGDFTLYAWNRGGRGQDSGVTLIPSSEGAFGNLRGLVHKVTR